MSFMTERYFQMLESHKLYDRIFDDYSLRLFVEYHVVCVWAYNYLLRDIYQELVSMIQPLNSQSQKEAIRLISETILEEEVEEQNDGSLLSHLEIYLEAMQALGADVGPILSFFDMQESGSTWEEALEEARFPPAVARYAQGLGRMFARPLHERAAVLFYEGEPFIPDTFLNRLGQLGAKHSVNRLLDYFERHIEGLKRPGFSASGRLVEIFCGDNPQLNDEAEKAAEEVMRLRVDLWNNLADQLGAAPGKAPNRQGLRLITSAL